MSMVHTRSLFLNELPRYGILTSAAMLQGVAMSVFLFPHHIPSGGAAGLAILFNHWFSLSLGFSLWMVNFAFLFLAFFWFGIPWTIRTMYSVTITALTVHYIKDTLHYPVGNLYLDLLIGSILFGIGVGLLIKHGASSGGMLIPALLISQSRNHPPGKTMFWINLSIFLLTALVINWLIILYAILCQWLSTRIIDFQNR